MQHKEERAMKLCCKSKPMKLWALIKRAIVYLSCIVGNVTMLWLCVYQITYMNLNKDDNIVMCS